MSHVNLPPRGTALVVVESVTSLTMIVLALTGNIFILAALYRNPRLRNTTNIYIAALAVADLLNTCLPGTLFASSIISGRLVYSMLGCKLSGYLVHFLTYVSMATMTLTAVNRYYRVVRPHLYQKIFCHKLSAIILLALWLIVGLFVLCPLAFGLGEFTFSPILSFCAYRFASQTSETVFTVIVVSVFVILCLSLVSWSYYQVSKVIQQHNNLFLHGVTAREIKITKALFALVLAFAVCWLPTFAIIVIMRFTIGMVSHSLGVVVPFLIQASSVVNPLIYGAMSPAFRNEFRQLLLFKRRKDQGSTADLSRVGCRKSPNENQIVPLEVRYLPPQEDPPGDDNETKNSEKQ